MKKALRLGAVIGALGLGLSIMGAGPATAPAAGAGAATKPALVPLTKEHEGNFRIAPPYEMVPEATVKEGVPKGKLIDFVMHSSDSKIYPTAPAGRGGAGGAFDRRVALYVPSQYVPGTAAPFMVFQDGVTQGRAPADAAAPATTVTGFYHDFLPRIMDNMIKEKRLPVMLLVLIQPGPGDGPGSERGLEYDTVSDRYTMFIENEVLPKIEKEQNVKFTKDPEGRGTAGGSSGAACAFTMAWFHPELYRKVLSYSGTFVNQAQNKDAPHGAWEYHATFIPSTDPKPIRVWLEVGQNDNGANAAEAGMHNWVIANQHMSEVLKAKGYHYQMVFAEGAGHVARPVLTATMSEAMEWLWSGYAPK